jgi:hypothetical protein
MLGNQIVYRTLHRFRQRVISRPHIGELGLAAAERARRRHSDRM